MTAEARAARDGKHFKVAGIGVLAVDHVFAAEPGEPFRYRGSRGGGSVWNVLAHLAQAGVGAIACGACGADDAGKEAAHELSELGVDIRGLAYPAGTRTPIFTQWLDESSRHGPAIPQDNFTVDCAVCGRPPPADIARFSGALSAPADVRCVCADRLIDETAPAIRRARDLGMTTALDLGGTAGIKDVDRALLRGRIGDFDIVAMPGAVASWLGETEAEVFAEALIGNGAGAVLVTGGRDGFRLRLRGPDGGLLRLDSAPYPIAAVVDATGAGDAVMARLIECSLRMATPAAGARGLTFPGDAPAALAEALRAAPAETLGGVGARASLPAAPPATAWGKRLASLQGTPLDGLRERLADTRPCVFCGQP
jgi:sugar/nucleoside kinase (ribokinase family)